MHSVKCVNICKIILAELCVLIIIKTSSIQCNHLLWNDYEKFTHWSFSCCSWMRPIIGKVRFFFWFSNIWTYTWLTQMTKENVWRNSFCMFQTFHILKMQNSSWIWKKLSVLKFKLNHGLIWVMLTLCLPCHAPV